MQFVQEQIGGDVLFPRELDGILGFGFIAAGPWNFIGHVEIPETKLDGKVARNLDRDDMVSNTLNAFCSVTIQCDRQRLTELRARRAEIDAKLQSLGPPPKFHGVVADKAAPEVRLLMRGDPESPIYTYVTADRPELWRRSSAANLSRVILRTDAGGCPGFRNVRVAAPHEPFAIEAVVRENIDAARRQVVNP